MLRSFISGLDQPASENDGMVIAYFVVVFFIKERTQTKRMNQYIWKIAAPALISLHTSPHIALDQHLYIPYLYYALLYKLYSTITKQELITTSLTSQVSNFEVSDVL